MGVRTRECRAWRVAAQSLWNRNSTPSTRQAGEEQKGHREKSSRNTFKAEDDKGKPGPARPWQQITDDTDEAEALSTSFNSQNKEIIATSCVRQRFTKRWDRPGVRRDELEMAEPEQDTQIPAPADTPRVLMDSAEVVSELFASLWESCRNIGGWEGAEAGVWYLFFRRGRKGGGNHSHLQIIAWTQSMEVFRKTILSN